MIDAGVPLILIHPLQHVARVVVRGTRRRGQRIPLQQGDRDRIHLCSRNGVPCERGPIGARRSERVVDHRHRTRDGFREDALALQQGRNGRCLRLRDRLPLSLVVQEEEGPIALHRSAERSAKLLTPVLGPNRRGALKVVARVQRLVPEEIEAGAAQLIGAGARRQVNHPPIEAAELRRRTVALDLEFLNRVDDRQVRHLAGLRLEHGDAVKQDRKSTRLNSSHRT